MLTLSESLRSVVVVVCLFVATAGFATAAEQEASKSDAVGSKKSHHFDGSGAKLIGLWSIEVPNQSGLQMFFNVQPEGTYSIHLGDAQQPPIETGKIQGRSGAYILVALTGEQKGKRDEGSFQFTANSRMILRSLYGKGTWSKVIPESSSELAKQKREIASEKESKSLPSPSSRKTDKDDEFLPAGQPLSMWEVRISSS